MKTTLYKATARGFADHGWLKANHYFSFAGYFNRERIQFGALRVLNDDIVAGGKGFGEHPHDNMEIITIPLAGALKHKDSMGNKWIELNVGEVQVMSAGIGLYHSEMNAREDEELKLFQIWIFPDKQDVEPRYDQKLFSEDDRLNQLQLLVTSLEDQNSDALKIHQNAKISRIKLSENQDFEYQLMSNLHGVFVLVVDGELTINNELLNSRDAIGIENMLQISLKTTKKSDIIFIEVPM
jgi:redox-sensitive bicupin YhaK (pirin superfamily)